MRFLDSAVDRKVQKSTFLQRFIQKSLANRARLSSDRCRWPDESAGQVWTDFGFTIHPFWLCSRLRSRKRSGVLQVEKRSEHWDRLRPLAALVMYHACKGLRLIQAVL